MKKILIGFILIILGMFTQAQNGLEGIVVEKYYVSNAADAAGSVGHGTLPEGSYTYRIYVDMLPGYKFQMAYGNANHNLTMTTTTSFYNNEDYGNYIPSFSKTNAAKWTTMVDSWLSVGAACNSNFGVLKTEDDGVNNVVNAHGLLQNNAPEMGIPLTTQDGFLAGSPLAATIVGMNYQVPADDGAFEVFGDGSVVGNSFVLTGSAWAALGGAQGPTTENRVLIAQITTDGTFHFELNIQIGTPTGGTENYVFSNPGMYNGQMEIFHPSLMQTFCVTSTTNTTTVTECDAYTWAVNGQTYTATGIYEVVIGCHTEILDLTINNSYIQTVCDEVTVYDNELPYLWNGQSLTDPGINNTTLQTIQGCDSIVCIILAIKPYTPLRITKNIGTAVQAEWDPIVDANLYQLRYRFSPMGMWVNVIQSTQLSRKIYELVPGEMYEMQLRHRVGTIWQPWASVYAPVIFEAEVIEFSTTYDIGTKLMVSWTEVPEASSYILQQWNPTTMTWSTRGYFPSNSAVIGTTLESTSYAYRICPRFAEVSFHWSAGGSITSGYIDITVSGFDGTEATFNWAPVMNPAASDYYLQIRVAGMPTIFSSNYTNTTSRFVTGMMADTDYECRLVVRYGAVAWGATSWRPVANQVTKEELVIFPQNNLNVYPNPVSDNMTVEINSTATSSHVWNLYDVNGKLVMSGIESLTEGLNYFYIDATQLSTGLYMLQSTFNGTVESTRIIKQ